jgi:methionine synthase II (cobalamin-independent)
MLFKLMFSRKLFKREKCAKCNNNNLRKKKKEKKIHIYIYYYNYYIIIFHFNYLNTIQITILQNRKIEHDIFEILDVKE